MRYKTVFWDFNGTIIDDTSLSIESINLVLKKRKLPLLNGLSDLQRLFCFPVKDYYEKLGMNFDTEPYEIPADEWVNHYTSKMLTVPLTVGIKEALKKMNDAHISQIILSASEKKMMITQTDSFGITSYFDQILGCDNVYAGGKTHIAKEWISNQKDFNVSDAVYIGDTDHDFETAKAIGCDCILYSGGFMSKERLLKHNVPVFEKIEDIVNYIVDK